MGADVGFQVVTNGVVTTGEWEVVVPGESARSGWGRQLDSGVPGRGPTA